MGISRRGGRDRKTAPRALDKATPVPAHSQHNRDRLPYPDSSLWWRSYRGKESIQNTVCALF